MVELGAEGTRYATTQISRFSGKAHEPLCRKYGGHMTDRSECGMFFSDLGVNFNPPTQ
jgi:hypothetical protein